MDIDIDIDIGIDTDIDIDIDIDIDTDIDIEIDIDIDKFNTDASTVNLISACFVWFYQWILLPTLVLCWKAFLVYIPVVWKSWQTIIFLNLNLTMPHREPSER